MKLFKLSILFILILGVQACNNDDTSDGCTQEAWIGDYLGTSECSGVTADAEVTITANGEETIMIKYITGGGSNDIIFESLILEDCRANFIDTTLIGDVNFEATLNGNELTLTNVISLEDGNQLVNCMITAVKN